MMVKKGFTITQIEAITKVAEALEGPTSVDEFVERVLKLWPPKAKTRESSIRNTINQDALGVTLLSPEPGTLPK